MQHNTAKHRPILFSTPMVEAILEGRKMQTRRTIKSKHESGLFQVSRRKIDGIITEITSIDWDERPVDPSNDIQPKWEVGVILWVREEHYRFGYWEKDNSKKRKSGRQSWKFVPSTNEVRYYDNPPSDFRKGRHKEDPQTPAWHKRLARFMPKSSCRLFLKITNIRVERLQEISEDDAISEGIECYNSPTGGDDYQDYYRDYSKPDDPSIHPWIAGQPIKSFETLWQKINGSESWDANPWVWVVEFERVEMPENFLS